MLNNTVVHEYIKIFWEILSYVHEGTGELGGRSGSCITQLPSLLFPQQRKSLHMCVDFCQKYVKNMNANELYLFAFKMDWRQLTIS